MGTKQSRFGNVFIKLKFRMFRYFDWTLLLCMLALITIGIISIAAATASPVTDESASLMDILQHAVAQISAASAYMVDRGHRGYVRGYDDQL